jgi:hypothetical protein
VLDTFGLVALGGLAWQVVAVDEFQPRLYQGGLAAVAVLAVVVVAAAGDARARLLPRLLGWEPLRWAGLRSYGIYLWHWPVFMLTRPQLDVSIDGAPLLALRVAVTFALAELSYRCVELPIRGGALGRAWRALRVARGAERWRLGARWASGAAVSLAATLALGVAAVEARPPIAPAYLDGASAEVETPGGSAIASDAPVDRATALVDTVVAPTSTPPRPTWVAARLPGFRRGPEDEPAFVATGTAAFRSDDQYQSGVDSSAAGRAGATDPAPTAVPPPTVAPAPPTATAPMLLLPAPLAAASAPVAQAAAQPALQPTAAGHVLSIGDSVMIGAAKQLGRVIGDIEVDAKVSRQASAAIKLVRARRDAGRLGDVVVIHIGSNGPFSARQFDDLMAQLADVRRVVVVTVKVPRRWEGPNNSVIVEGVKRYPNAVLADWRSASADHPELFWRDGIHLRPAGVRLYADLIAVAVSAP